MRWIKEKDMVVRGLSYITRQVLRTKVNGSLRRGGFLGGKPGKNTKIGGLSCENVRQFLYGIKGVRGG